MNAIVSADTDDLWWVDDEDGNEGESDNSIDSNNNTNSIAGDSSASSSPVPKPTTPPSARGRYLYVIRNGKADVFYESINPATLGASKIFGEGGFLFRRNHSASVVAATDQLECFRV